MEVGPWRMDGKGGFKTMEGGWEEYTTMVYGKPFDFHVYSFANPWTRSGPTCWHRLLIHKHGFIRAHPG